MYVCMYVSVCLSLPLFISLSLCLSLSLSLSHTHTHTLSLAHTLTHHIGDPVGVEQEVQQVHEGPAVVLPLRMRNGSAPHAHDTATLTLTHAHDPATLTLTMCAES